MTSVAHVRPPRSAAREASRLSVVIAATASSNRSPVALCRLFRTPRPSGLVSVSGVPGAAGVVAQQPVGVGQTR